MSTPTQMSTPLETEMLEALQWLLEDVENVIDMGVPFENPENGFHVSVMAARAVIAKAEGRTA